jgi:hypothetical protein
MPHSDRGERRKRNRDSQQRFRDKKAAPNPFALLTNAGFQPPAGPATIPLRTSGDVIAAIELAVSLAYAADETLDLCSRLRLITMAAIGASRCQDAAAIETRISELEMQRSALTRDGFVVQGVKIHTRGRFSSRMAASVG